jgi:SAM-dependent methyltransferase
LVPEGAVITVGTKNEEPRAAWLEKALAEVPAGWRILDAGAGELRWKKFCAHLRYVSQDFAQYDGKGNAVGLQTGTWDQSKLDIVSDITAIPEPDGSFDALMCVEVLEHVPDPVLAIREFARLVRPGGRLILTAPFCSITHFAPYHYSTGFSRYYYEHHLPANGFEIQELTPNGNYFEYVAQELRRSRSVAVQYGGQWARKWQSLALYVVLRMLQRFGDHGQQSAELLHFGFHVKAVRR